jgi:hypothetical protein
VVGCTIRSGQQNPASDIIDVVVTETYVVVTETSVVVNVILVFLVLVGIVVA